MFSVELEPSISGQDRLSISSESVASVADSETNYSESIAGASVSESLEKSDFKNKAYDDRLNEIGQVDGSPVVVQTGNGIKVLAEVELTRLLYYQHNVQSRYFIFIGS